MRNRYKVINMSVSGIEAALNDAAEGGWEIVEDIDYYFTSFGQRMATVVMARLEGEN
jgi:hypothetical protein